MEASVLTTVLYRVAAKPLATESEKVCYPATPKDLLNLLTSECLTHALSPLAGDTDKVCYSATSKDLYNPLANVFCLLTFASWFRESMLSCHTKESLLSYKNGMFSVSLIHCSCWVSLAFGSCFRVTGCMSYVLMYIKSLCFCMLTSFFFHIRVSLLSSSNCMFDALLYVHFTFIYSKVCPVMKSLLVFL